MAQSDPQMTPKWSQNDPQTAPKWSQNDTQTDPQMIPEWPQMTPKWSQNDPKWHQNDPRMTPNVTQMIPTWPKLRLHFTFTFYVLRVRLRLRFTFTCYVLRLRFTFTFERCLCTSSIVSFVPQSPSGGQKWMKRRSLRIQGRMQIFRKISQKALNRILTVPQYSTRRELPGATLKIF